MDPSTLLNNALAAVGVSLALLNFWLVRRLYHAWRGRPRPVLPATSAQQFDRRGSVRHVPSPGLEAAIAARVAQADALRRQCPQETLEELKDGNARFWTGCAQRPQMSKAERRTMIALQTPKVAVLACADSRVPVEIVLDQGLGDIFAIRTAGAVGRSTAAASLEYAVHHLGVRLIVVLGHEGCGAVAAAQLSDEEIAREPPRLRGLLAGIKEDLGGAVENLKKIRDPRARAREAAAVNTLAQVRTVVEDVQMRAMVDSGELLVVGATYDMTTGVVEFYEPLPARQAARAAADQALHAKPQMRAAACAPTKGSEGWATKTPFARQVPYVHATNRSAAA